MGIVDNALMGASGQSGYNLTRSLRFRKSASTYLSRTPASAGNQKTWTWSGWVKRGLLSTADSLVLFGANSSNTDSGNIELSFINTNALAVVAWNSYYLISTPVYRDPAGWYHIVLAVDTTNATANNRMRLYVNGAEVTAFGTRNNPTQNADLPINNTIGHQIGAINYSGGIGLARVFDGYMTEVNFIDGQALTQSSFGSTNTITGVWQPKKYAGTYGTNGFYLPFTDNSALTTSSNVGLGKDFSGNANYWTTNNISITAGTTYDSMTDVPTLTSTTAANYAVVNPLKKPASSTISNGNLTVTFDANGGEQPNTIAISSGKWYWEQTQNATFAAPGIILSSATPSGGSISQGYHYYGGNGLFYTGTSGATYGATFGNGDIIGIALDLDNNQITFYKNNVSQGVKSIVAGEYNPDFAAGTTITINANFGQRPFAYTAPTGFLPLNTYNI